VSLFKQNISAVK